MEERKLNAGTCSHLGRTPTWNSGIFIICYLLFVLFTNLTVVFKLFFQAGTYYWLLVGKSHVRRVFFFLSFFLSFFSVWKTLGREEYVILNSILLTGRVKWLNSTSVRFACRRQSRGHGNLTLVEFNHFTLQVSMLFFQPKTPK